MGYQNLGWSGMSKNECVKKAIETNSVGSCAYLSFAPTYNNGQTGCWCFKEEECQNVQAQPAGQDGSWTTWKVDNGLLTGVEGLSGTPGAGRHVFALFCTMMLF